MKKLVLSTLKDLDLYSEDSSNLVLGTIAQESDFGKYRKQIGGGPALGIAQVEPATFYDIVENYLDYRPKLKERVMKVCGIDHFDHRDLETNDKLSIAMCRLKYLRVKDKIPGTVEGYARYYKKYYNTYQGKATEHEFILKYRKYVQKAE